MTRALIRGDGIAACCCEHLLRRAGCETIGDRVDRPRLPAIMLSDAAIALIEDVFDRRGVLNGIHRIRKRVVAWSSEPVELQHSAGVVSERQLLDYLQVDPTGGKGDADWTVFTSRPLPAGTEEHHFGSRTAWALPVSLVGSGDTCWIESLAEGWLFLIPNSRSAGWLLAVGAEPASLLEESLLIAGQIGEVCGAPAEFPAYPRIFSPLCGPEWIACGSAAMAFDPLCGDGTANAVREAILACAAIRSGMAALPHYEARLSAGFQRHLASCVNFYRTGGSGVWWQRELAALHAGLEWCARRSKDFDRYRYQLKGFDLVELT